jgi:uncharacterized membrane protein YjfL (UPF0719 family)
MNPMPLALAFNGAIIVPALLVCFYRIVGTVLAIIGYKLFDLCTPGNLHDEIIKNRNTAAAIVAAAIILGICLIVAAAIMG